MPEPPSPPSGPFRNTALTALGVFLIALLVYGYDLSSEPVFVDEWAFLGQSYFFDLLISGRVNDPGWLEYPAYDLPPLPKYLIGAAIELHGFSPPERGWAKRWQLNTKTKTSTPDVLLAARPPSVLLGAFGCVALFAIGYQVGGPRVGLLAACLLMVNPLYRLHARRAMSDVPAEAFTLTALAVGLSAWRRELEHTQSALRGRLGAALSGAASGLAVLSKLTGFLSIMTLAVWSALAIGETGVRRRIRIILRFGLAALIALCLFVALNPFVYAHPNSPPVRGFLAIRPNTGIVSRLRIIIEHRVEVSKSGQQRFPADALRTPGPKIAAMAVQGFGRFGPFGPAHSDSTRRYDWQQDWGALLWGPLVLAGACVAFLRGRHETEQGRAPVSWAALTQWCLALITVGAFLPLAWDRYFLPIQAGSCLMASLAIVTAWDRLRRLRPLP